jgi:hypothetical protein
MKMLTFPIEQRKLAARLGEAPLKVAALGGVWAAVRIRMNVYGRSGVGRRLQLVVLHVTPPQLYLA